MGAAGLFNNGILSAAPNTKNHKPTTRLINSGRVRGLSTHNLLGYSADQLSRGGTNCTDIIDRYKCPHQNCDFASRHPGAAANHTSSCVHSPDHEARYPCGRLKRTTQARDREKLRLLAAVKNSENVRDGIPYGKQVHRKQQKREPVWTCLTPEQKKSVRAATAREKCAREHPDSKPQKKYR